MTDDERYDLAIHRAYEVAIEKLFSVLITDAANHSSFDVSVNKYRAGVALVERLFKEVSEGF